MKVDKKKEGIKLSKDFDVVYCVKNLFLFVSLE